MNVLHSLGSAVKFPVGAMGDRPSTAVARGILVAGCAYKVYGLYRDGTLGRIAAKATRVVKGTATCAATTGVVALACNSSPRLAGIIAADAALASLVYHSGALDGVAVRSKLVAKKIVEYTVVVGFVGIACAGFLRYGCEGLNKSFAVRPNGE